MNDLLRLNSHEATGEIINFVFILFQERLRKKIKASNIDVRTMYDIM